MATELIRSMKGMMHHGVTGLYPSADDDKPSGGPARVQLRRLRFALRRDPLAALTSAPVAIRLADELLALTAIAQPDTEIWCSLAVAHGGGTTGLRLPCRHRSRDRMVRNTVSAIHDAGPADPIWDDAETACHRPAGSVQLRAAFLGYVDLNHVSDSPSRSSWATLWPRSADHCTNSVNAGS